MLNSTSFTGELSIAGTELATYIINIEKIIWKLKRIEIFSENLKRERLINFKVNNDQLFSILKKHNLEIHQSPISPEHLGTLIKLISSDKISGKLQKKFSRKCFSRKNLPKKL